MLGENMSFKEISDKLKVTYNSANEDIVNEFYNPVLSHAVRYDRISGFFSSTSLAIAARGIVNFIKNNGHMRILCGAKLSEDDLNSIQNADELKNIVNKNFIEDIDNIEEEVVKKHVMLLGWMVANNFLEIKIGINKKDNGEYFGDGMLHSKIGILYDENNDSILFDGSVNETAYGWKNNIESLKIFYNWKNEEYMESDKRDFEEFWENKNDNLEIFSIPEASKAKLVEIAPKNEQEFEDLVIKENYSKKPKLRDYQKDAIEAWFKNDCKGILEMATGTGKTFTAINSLMQLSEQLDNLITVVACPYAHLVEQWAEELEEYDLGRQFNIYSSINKNWKKDLSKLVSKIKRDRIKKAIIFTTHKTCSNELFRTKINEINTNLFLIADEMHHLGASGYMQGLLPNYKYRLGLSATPSKYMDEEATDYLLDYFGGIIFTFGLKEALLMRNPDTNQTYLTPYMYYPKKVGLTREEIEEYKFQNKKLVVAMNSKNSSDKEDTNINSILIKRARILNNAEAKYAMLRNILRSYDNLDHLIIFCSDKQIEKVLKILKEEGVYPRHRFTSNEGAYKKSQYNNKSERQILLEKFDKGIYKALVAIKCLDEGVDVPSADKVIIMSSTTNPMEYIQRRGRVLRRYPGKELAFIYDMMVVPDVNESFADSIIEKELKRLSEFIHMAKNSDECNDLLKEWEVLS